MGLSTKIFIVNDDDTIEPFPLTRYERLLRRDPEFKIPKYAGRRIRYVSVVVDLKDRKPETILNIQYFYLAFDTKGRLDVDEREKKARLALDMQPPVYPDKDDRQTIDARHKFAKKRYDSKYKWALGGQVSV